MAMNDVIDCVTAVSRAMDKFDLRPGQITHTLAQIQTALEQDAQQLIVHLERSITDSVRSSKGGKIDVSRDIDVVAEDLIRRIHTEIKTGAKLSDAINFEQLSQDAAIAIRNVMDREAKTTAKTLENVWKFTNIDFGEKLPATIKNNVQNLVKTLASEGFSPEHLRAAIASFSFVDSAGRVIKAELAQNGDLLFRDAMGNLFGPDGKVAQEAKKATGNSPNFAPAMETLFGPSGKVAHAASQAAGGANLDPALQGLEKKLETGIGKVMDEAGNAVQKLSAKELIGKVGAGIGALGSAISSIPQMHQAIKTLGEAWDKPLKSTEDYMNLMSAVGGVVSQAGGVIQAFAGLTELASAAQAVFNAVMAMNPIVLVVIAVVALIAAIVLLIVYWDKVKAAIRDNPWIAVIAVMFGVIGIIIVVIAYWDEIKLAVLKAANFISIQVQKIGQFFVGMGNLIGQVWNWITASVENVGIAIINTFMTMGANVSNFFIGFVNGIIDMINTVGDALGLGTISKIPEVNVQANLIPPKDVPKIDVDAAFRPTGEIKGGLEDQIAKQEGVVAKAREEDETRRKAKAQPGAAPGAPGAAPGAVPGAPAVPPVGPTAPGAIAPPALPGGLGVPPAAAAAGGPSNTTVNLGGITVTINADRLEANASQMLSDEIVSALSERLSALLATQNFRTGERPA